MEAQEISTPRDLDTALGANALRKRAQLWKVAEGRSFRWAEALGLAAGLLLVVIGASRFSEDAGGTVLLALGLAMAVGTVLGHLQRQLSALVEVVKRLERESSRR
jgi:hypothetical protein